MVLGKTYDTMMLDYLIGKADRLYGEIPIHLQFAIDEQDDSGLEPEELLDGYERLGIQ